MTSESSVSLGSPIEHGARSSVTKTAEELRLLTSEARSADWKNFGPYLSERAWGTVREDYRCVQLAFFGALLVWCK